MVRFRTPLLYEGECEIELQFYSEAWVLSIVMMKVQVQGQG